MAREHELEQLSVMRLMQKGFAKINVCTAAHLKMH
jgi:hypothetical protein